MKPVLRPIQVCKQTLLDKQCSDSFDGAILETLDALCTSLREWNITFEIIVFSKSTVHRYHTVKEPVLSETGKLINFLRPFSSTPMNGFVCKSKRTFESLYSLTEPVFHIPFQFSWGALHWVCRGLGCQELLGGERRFMSLIKKLKRKNEIFNILFMDALKSEISEYQENQKLFQSLTHEIKSPLQQLMMLSDESDATDEIRTIVRHTKSMVDDVLHCSQDVRIRNQTWSINELMQELQLYYLHQPFYANIEWECENHIIHCDRNRILQVVIVVMDNALEAMSEASTLSFLTECSDEGVALSVSNTGDMIPSELQEILFDPYVSSKAGGSGLGLFMVKKIMKALKGDIELTESTSRKTTFTVRFTQ